MKPIAKLLTPVIVLGAALSASLAHADKLGTH